MASYMYICSYLDYKSWREEDKQIEVILLALEGLFTRDDNYDGRGARLFYERLDTGRTHPKHPSLPSQPRELLDLFALVEKKVGEEDVLLILYDVFLGVGVEEEELLMKLRNHCNTELADSMYIHEKYPDFSVLLALGNILASSISDYGDFDASLDDVTLMYYDLKKDLKNDFNEFRKSHATQICEYFEQLKIKKNGGILQRAMTEGYVSLININIIICGPPYVGKTAFKALLLNKEAPLKHNSTPIAARPVQAIEILADGDKVWKEVSDDDLLQMLSNTIRTQNILHTRVSRPKEPITPAVGTISKLSHTAVLFEERLAEVPNSITLSNGINVTLRYQHTAELDFVSQKIVDQLASAEMRKVKDPVKLHESTWIRLIDSGGQPQFIDLLHLFIRDNSLYIIVMKVTESLHDKPTFAYSLDGKPVSVPKELSMTNLQIIESFVRSASAASRHKMTNSKPSFAIVATNCDQSKFRRWIGLDENLMTKNKILQDSLKQFLDLFIFYNRDSNELIFPVDNLCWWNRKKISNEIRDRLLSSRSDIRLKVKIPIRWYSFDLNMKKEASKEPHGVISLESCYTIGSKLDMNKAEIIQCLLYLDSVRLCIYYPNIIPHAVFTNPQFLIDSVSNIVRVSFVDDLQQILPEGVSLSDEIVQSLKRDGVLDESLLDSLGQIFIANLFSKSDLISLLQHFCVISPVTTASNTTKYFIPILLPTERLTRNQRAIIGASIDPLIITMNEKNLLLQGLFPALTVSLLSRQNEPRFFIDSTSSDFPKQLRYAVKLFSEDLFGSVFLCDGFTSIEVYFTGPPQNRSVLRRIVLEGLSSSAEVLGYDEKSLNISALVWCSRKHISSVNDDEPHLITISDKTSPPAIGCSKESGLPTVTLNNISEKKSCWLKDFCCCNLSAPTSNLLPDVLDQRHASVILKAIKDLVVELEEFGIHLGLSNAIIQEIKVNAPHEIRTRRKDIIIAWLETGTATRSALISALEDVERFDIATVVKGLPTV